MSPIPRLHSPGPRLLVRNASEICLPDPAGPGVQRLPRCALYVEDGRVAWLGPEDQRPAAALDAPEWDAEGRAVLPALVDSHTHLLYGGDRIADFDRRSRGLSYAEIAAEGAGIHTTVAATRSAELEVLVARGRAFLERRVAHGIGTSEVKSGYGLSVASELKMLEAAAILRAEGWDLETTLLAAHTVPKDQPRAAWLREIEEVLIPACASRGLARFVDVFVERGAYTVEEARSVFGAGRAHGL